MMEIAGLKPLLLAIALKEPVTALTTTFILLMLLKKLHQKNLLRKRRMRSQQKYQFNLKNQYWIFS
jgi:hypothetical protein